MAEVVVNKLWNPALWPNINDMFEYSKWAELVVCDWISPITHWDIDSITRGEDDRYDVLMSGHKIEVKFSSSENITIEYANAKKKPTGIFATQSEYYLVVHTGWANHMDSWKKVGKIRLLDTNTLKSKVIDHIERGNFVALNDTAGPGRRCVVLNSKTDFSRSTDGWLGDVPYQLTSVGHTYYFNKEHINAN